MENYSKYDNLSYQEVIGMIKKTFYNLPYEKRKRITDAVIKEFMERPNEKVSINRIIKTAEISRGSFYV